MCTNPSTVRRAINGPDDNPLPPPSPLVDCRTGGNGAAAKIGLGNVAIPCIFECDMDLIVVDSTIPPPMLLLLLAITADWLLAPPSPLFLSPPAPLPPVAAPAELSGIDVISTVVHSRPLAKKTRLVTDRIYLDMTPSKLRSEERSWLIIVCIGGDITISTAITGWTCELCANDAILVAETFGNVDSNCVGITEAVDDDDIEFPTAVTAMLLMAFTFKYAGTA